MMLRTILTAGLLLFAASAPADAARDRSDAGSNAWGSFTQSKPAKAYTKKTVRKRPPARVEGGPKPFIPSNTPGTVAFKKSYKSGSVVIDTAGRKLYYVLGNGRAYAYPVAVGKKGFAWSGTQKVSKVVNWPGWTPPDEMRRRKPQLPQHMTGGIKNPLGAKAIYLGNSLYRIHGTNDPSSIGTAASSGCIRMHNGHVVHLSKLIHAGTRVHVVRKLS